MYNLKIFSSVILELSGKFKHITINKINADINKIGLILSWWKAEIKENEQRIIIKGTVHFGSPGKSINNFDLVNDKGNKICKGHFNIKDKAKGYLFLDCFDGKYKGEGSFVNSGYDVEKRFMNGTAMINLNDNATMRVIYGTDAL